MSDPGSASIGDEAEPSFTLDDFIAATSNKGKQLDSQPDATNSPPETVESETTQGIKPVIVESDKSVNIESDTTHDINSKPVDVPNNAREPRTGTASFPDYPDYDKAPIVDNIESNDYPADDTTMNNTSTADYPDSYPDYNNGLDTNNHTSEHITLSDYPVEEISNADYEYDWDFDYEENNDTLDDLENFITPSPIRDSIKISRDQNPYFLLGPPVGAMALLLLLFLPCVVLKWRDDIREMMGKPRIYGQKKKKIQADKNSERRRPVEVVSLAGGPAPLHAPKAPRTHPKELNTGAGKNSHHIDMTAVEGTSNGSSPSSGQSRSTLTTSDQSRSASSSLESTSRKGSSGSSSSNNAKTSNGRKERENYHEMDSETFEQKSRSKHTMS